MNEDRLNDLLRGLEPAEAAEIREFAHREPWEQNVYLFREIKSMRATKPVSQRLYEFGYVAALIAYMLVDQRGNLPPLFGGGK